MRCQPSASCDPLMDLMDYMYFYRRSATPTHLPWADPSLSGHLTRTRLPFLLNNIRITSSKLLAPGRSIGGSLVDHLQIENRMEGYEDKISFKSKYMTVVIPWPASPVTFPALEAFKGKKLSEPMRRRSRSLQAYSDSNNGILTVTK
jgi:hypothetical protein